MNTSAEFQKYHKIRTNLVLSIRFDQYLRFIQASIKNHHNKNIFQIGCIKKKQRSLSQFDISEAFQRTFQNLQPQQKKDFYVNIIKYTELRLNKQIQAQQKLDFRGQNFNIKLKKFSYSYWYDTIIRILPQQSKIEYLFEGKKQTIHLQHFLIRKSKKQLKFYFVLQSIQNDSNLKYRILCQSEHDYSTCFNQIKSIIYKKENQKIEVFLKELLNSSSKQESTYKTDHNSNMIFNNESKLITKDTRIQKQQPTLESKNLKENPTVDPLYSNFHLNTEQQVVESIYINSKSLQNNYQKLNSHETSKDEVLFLSNKYFSTYNLYTLSQESDYQIWKQEGSNKILMHKNNKQNYKIIYNSNHNKQILTSVFLDVMNYNKWKKKLESTKIMFKLTSENTLIIHEKYLNKYNCVQECLFLRYLFNNKNITYIIDKPIKNEQNTQLSIQKNKLKYRFFSLQSIQNRTKIIIETELIQQNQQIQWNFQNDFQQLKMLNQYIETLIKNGEQKQILIPLDLQWDINLNSKQQNNTENRKFFEENLCSQIPQENESFFYTVKQGSEISIKSNNSSKINNEKKNYKKQMLDQIQEDFEEYNSSFRKTKYQNRFSEADLKISNDYLVKKYKFKPFRSEKSIKFRSSIQNHHLWKNIWAVRKQGGITCTNQVILTKQHQIFSNLKKFYKNLSKNSNLFNIPFPIQVFSQMSMLQYVASSFTLSPYFLQKAILIDDPLQRFKYGILTGVSKILLSIQMEKPFKGILGETYQGWINGCPIYCQQIGARPQIIRHFMQGRGYKIYGSTQTIVELNINSAVGINEGDSIIEFQKYPQQKIHFRSPKGEITGVLFGERNFFFTGKAYFFDEYNNYFGEINFNPAKSIEKKNKKFLDCIEGIIYQVDVKFIQKLKTFNSNHEFQIVPKLKVPLCKISGRWTDSIIFDKIQYYNVNIDIPYILQNQSNPLISDSIYRSDIFYRKKHDFVRSQIENQKLQDIQRRDLILRMKKERLYIDI